MKGFQELYDMKPNIYMKMNEKVFGLFFSLKARFLHQMYFRKN